jgi:hypothetical protein
MKAPLVREESKENGTQVTGNQIYKGCLVCKLSLPDHAQIQFLIANTPGAASRDGRKLVERFMAGKRKIVPRSRSAKIPSVSLRPRRRGSNFRESVHSLDGSSRLAIALFNKCLTVSWRVKFPTQLGSRLRHQG